MNSIESKGQGSVSECFSVHKTEIVAAIGSVVSTAAVAAGILSIMTGFIPYGGWALIGTGGLTFAGIASYLVYDQCRQKEALKLQPRDYTQAILTDFFENDGFNTLPELFPYLGSEFPNCRMMTAPVMRGWLPNSTRCLLIKLESHDGEHIHIKAITHPTTGVLILFKDKYRNQGEAKWMQYSDLVEKPSFFREWDTNCLVGESKLIESEEDKKHKFEQEALGFSLVQELLKNGETTDLRGNHWKIHGW